MCGLSTKDNKQPTFRNHRQEQTHGTLTPQTRRQKQKQTNKQTDKTKQNKNLL